MQMPLTFMYPAVLALILLVVPVLWLRRKRQSALGHPQVGIHRNLRAVSLVGRLPAILLTLAFAALIGALARPVLPDVKETRAIQTRDIVIAVDISGSMDGAIPGAVPPPNSTPQAGNTTQAGGGANSQQYRRKDAAQDAVIQFVKTREGDRIALFIFDDNTYYHWPLSDDLRIILRKAGLLSKNSGGGTNFEGPTGPIQSAINHLRDYGQAKTKVLIMVSDGESNISPQRFNELSAMMEAQGIKIYLLGVGESWTGSGGSSSSMTADLRRFVEKHNGKVFAVGSAEEMNAAFAAINQLEVSKVELEQSTEYKDIFQYFAWASALLLVGFLASLTITRETA
jgi:Ca-activated chloride channel homolog